MSKDNWTVLPFFESKSDGLDPRKMFKRGQKFPTPGKADSTRAFYESLLEENPESKIAIRYCVEYGVLPAESHEKLLCRYSSLKEKGAYEPKARAKRKAPVVVATDCVHDAKRQQRPAFGGSTGLPLDRAAPESQGRASQKRGLVQPRHTGSASEASMPRSDGASAALLAAGRTASPAKCRSGPQRSEQSVTTPQ